MIRKAGMDDKPSILNMIQRVIADMESKGIDQWDGVYPDEDVIKTDLAAGTLYVYEDKSVLKGMIVLNNDQSEEYKNVNWSFHAGKQLVIHRLCVDPRFQGQGIARQLMSDAEEYGRKLYYHSVRLDAFTENTRACRFYERLGYRKAGVVRFRKGEFYCFEKDLK